jgi:PPM family protein phosphatase
MIRGENQRAGRSGAGVVRKATNGALNYDLRMSVGYRITAATGIHKGDREYQQDQVAMLSHPRVNGCMLGVVADGMGGRSGGRKASDQVMMTTQQLFERFSPEHDDPPSFLTQVLNESHLVIKLTAISSEMEPHSTFAAFLINPDGECYWLHSGDSRIYHYHGVKMVKRTLDHSYVQTLVDKGEITEDEANSHPQSNILMGCLGIEEDPPYTRHYIAKLRVGDVLFACSDGVWHYFSPNEMGQIVSQLPPRESVEYMIAKARSRARGSGDNLSIALVKLDMLEERAIAKRIELPSMADVKRGL